MPVKILEVPRVPAIEGVLCRFDDGTPRVGRLSHHLVHFLAAVHVMANGKPTGCALPGGQAGIGRSEEHTSELQSLMRISYADFCLKKKNKYMIRTFDVTK